MNRFPLVLLAGLLATGTLYSQNVEIPDPAFLNAVIEKGVDADGNGMISFAEAEAVTTLNVSRSMEVPDPEITFDADPIKDMTGIEAFINLDTLWCMNNELSSLDVSQNTALTYLKCDYNQISSLDISTCISLRKLRFRSNQISGLDVSHCTALKYLDCSENLLSSLDITRNIHLEYLSVRKSPLLHEICVWELPFPPDGVTVNSEYSPNISYTTECHKRIVFIPDPAFLQALIEDGVDTDGDGLISYDEAEALQSMDVSRYDPEQATAISDMTGIEAFINLNSLYCQGNLIGSLDVSSCTSLQELICFDNQISSLDISGCKYLMILECGKNQLTELDVSDYPALIFLSCFENLLTSLDITGCGSLTNLECMNNQLSMLDISDCINLRILRSGNNQLGKLDFSNCPQLEVLDCGDNQFTSLDVSGCSAITFLRCNNNLLTGLDIESNSALEFLDCSGNQFSSLDISNNLDINELSIENCPRLGNVCVWELPFPPAGVLVDKAGSPNVVFTLDCAGNFVEIPDPAFLQALIKEGVDTDRDGRISFTEAEAITVLRVVGRSYLGDNLNAISDLTGIEAFINLETLWCWGNILSSLDVSACTKLSHLSCAQNRLTHLNVSACELLAYLNCSENLLAELDLSGNPAIYTLECRENRLTNLILPQDPSLTYLYCGENVLESLDVSNCTELTYLSCYKNSLSNLDISNNPLLTRITCNENLLSSLDLSGNPQMRWALVQDNQLADLNISGNANLEYLSCFNNQLANLDVSSNPLLSTLRCSNNPFTSLDISNNEGLQVFTVQDCPLLSRICVWQLPFPPAGVRVNISGSPNVVFQDCTLPDTQEPDNISVSSNAAESEKISIYPNPTTDLISIQTGDPAGTIVTIRSLNGNMLISEEMTDTIHRMDISKLKKGVYFITISSNRHTTTRRIIKL